jgi:SAM-dependent methyltransferase
MDRAVYERMAEIDGEHWWFVGRRAIVEGLIARFAPQARPLRILEVGCGTGSNIPLLERFGRVDAIEPDDGARALAAARTGIAVKGGYLPDGVPLEDGAYDLIVLLDVLEHIPEDRPALARLRAALKPDGRLLLTVPASPWMWSSHDVAHHHQRRYTMRAVRRVVEASGFTVLHRSHFNSLLFPLIAGVRLVGKLTGREGGDDAMPGRGVNRLLSRLFGGERHLVGRIPLPFGVSIALVAGATKGPGPVTL